MPKVWSVTAQDLVTIERMSRCWLPGKYMVEILGVTVDQYKYARENDPRVQLAENKGRSNGALKLYEAAFEVAVEERDAKMIQFILKAQEGWRDNDGANINIATFGNLPSAAEALKILQEAATPRLTAPVDITPLEEDG